MVKLQTVVTLDFLSEEFLSTRARKQLEFDETLTVAWIDRFYSRFEYRSPSMHSSYLSLTFATSTGTR